MPVPSGSGPSPVERRSLSRRSAPPCSHLNRHRTFTREKQLQADGGGRHRSGCVQRLADDGGRVLNGASAQPQGCLSRSRVERSDKSRNAITSVAMPPSAVSSITVEGSSAMSTKASDSTATESDHCPTPSSSRKYTPVSAPDRISAFRSSARGTWVVCAPRVTVMRSVPVRLPP